MKIKYKVDLTKNYPKIGDKIKAKLPLKRQSLEAFWKNKEFILKDIKENGDIYITTLDGKTTYTDLSLQIHEIEKV